MRADQDQMSTNRLRAHADSNSQTVTTPHSESAYQVTGRLWHLALSQLRWVFAGWPWPRRSATGALDSIRLGVPARRGCGP